MGSLQLSFSPELDRHLQRCGELMWHDLAALAVDSELELLVASHLFEDVERVFQVALRMRGGHT